MYVTVFGIIVENTIIMEEKFVQNWRLSKDFKDK